MYKTNTIILIVIVKYFPVVILQYLEKYSKKAAKQTFKYGNDTHTKNNVDRNMKSWLQF